MVCFAIFVDRFNQRGILLPPDIFSPKMKFSFVLDKHPLWSQLTDKQQNDLCKHPKQRVDLTPLLFGPYCVEAATHSFRACLPSREQQRLIKVEKRKKKRQLASSAKLSKSELTKSKVTSSATHCDDEKQQFTPQNDLKKRKTIASLSTSATNAKKPLLVDDEPLLTDFPSPIEVLSSPAREIAVLDKPVDKKPVDKKPPPSRSWACAVCTLQCDDKCLACPVCCTPRPNVGRMCPDCFHSNAIEQDCCAACGCRLFLPVTPEKPPLSSPPRKSRESPAASAQQPPIKQWQCSFCTVFNDSDTDACAMCARNKETFAYTAELSLLADMGFNNCDNDQLKRLLIKHAGSVARAVDELSSD